MAETRWVEIPCPCPGTPHAEGDRVGLRPKLGLKSGVILQRIIIDARKAAAENKGVIDEGAITGDLCEAYLLHGVAEWTLVDADGAAIPVNEDTIRSQLLDDFGLASPIADAADELYLDPVISPLLVTASSSSRPSPTNGSTSAPTGRTPKQRNARRLSKPSSTSTTQTGATATITASLDGDSS